MGAHVGWTLVGEAADTIIFCLVAWVGVMSWAVIADLALVGFLYKVAVEIVFLPADLPESSTSSEARTQLPEVAHVWSKHRLAGSTLARTGTIHTHAATSVPRLYPRRHQGHGQGHPARVGPRRWAHRAVLSVPTI